MKTTHQTARKALLATGADGRACQPTLRLGTERQGAGRCDPTRRFRRLPDHATAWLNQKAPAANETALEALLKDPVFLTRPGPAAAHLQNRRGQAGGLCQGGVPPTRRSCPGCSRTRRPWNCIWKARCRSDSRPGRRTTTRCNPAALEIWKKILAGRSGRQGRPLSETGHRHGACAPRLRQHRRRRRGKTPADPVVRYKYYKTAHQNKELFPSFDHLTVWEYTRIVCSGASDADLTWAREMINTFRPDLRADEMVVNSTSFVWRRSAPTDFYPNGGYQNFKNVLAGGGKCGPRSSWSVMVCHAFGIPAIGVGQPAHACVAYKAANPMTQPQPGSAWKVGYGRGWEVSKLEGMKGPDFLAGVEKRSRRGEVLAGGTPALVRRRAGSRRQGRRGHGDRPQDPTSPSRPPKTDLTASLKAGRGGSRSRRQGGGNGRTSRKRRRQRPPIARPAAPIKAVAGVIHVEAASFAKTGGKISWGGQIPACPGS